MRALILILLLSLSVHAQETTLWRGAAENITKDLKGLSELELTIAGKKVTGFWRFLPGLEYNIEEGQVDGEMIRWWHRRIKGRDFYIELRLSPDGKTGLCDYWAIYPDPKKNTRGQVIYSRVDR